MTSGFIPRVPALLAGLVTRVPSFIAGIAGLALALVTGAAAVILRFVTPVGGLGLSSLIDALLESLVGLRLLGASNHRLIDSSGGGPGEQGAADARYYDSGGQEANLVHTHSNRSGAT
ncbi:hypothetical protein [Nocardia sp. NPDC052316]|uniref:hypothetical protein n=1 Tax=Nocardia sp. NPDC052316 TaxID=3364329 RepID=UPI0037C7E2AC